MFLEKLCESTNYEGAIITGACIVQALIFMCLLTITCLHKKAAVVTKRLVKSICLGEQL